MRRAPRPRNHFFGVLDRKLEIVKAPSLHAPEKVKFVANINQRLRVHVHLLVRDCEPRHLFRSTPKEFWHQFDNKAVWNKANKNTDWDGEESEHKGNAPHSSGLVFVCNRESSAAHEDDQNLTAHHESANCDKEPVACQAFKDVKFVVQASITKRGEKKKKVSTQFIQRLSGVR